MGYAVIPIIVSFVLGIQHIFLTDASRWSKLLVTIVVATSFVIWWYYAQWIVVATLMQVGVSIYMIVYLRVQE